MEFVFTAEQEDLRRTVRRFVEERSTEADVRILADSSTGHDAGIWAVMADQLGLQGLAVPDRRGGSGASLVELGIVFEEFGRALACAPFFSTVALGAGVLSRCGDEASQERFLPGIASGDTIATLALAEEAGSWDLSDVRDTQAERVGEGWVLEGAKSFVLDGCRADLILVVARTPDGIGLFAVDGEACGMDRRPLKTLDSTRRLARLRFARTPARFVASGPGLAESLEISLAAAAVCLAAEAVGGAQACLDMAVDYAKSRFQFGRPIGSFQAVKHKCADMLIAVESARSAAYHGMWTAEGSAELLEAGPLAKSACSDAYFFAAAQNLQVHGGIGFTWEHPAHLYLRRAKSSQSMLGGSTYQRRVLARRVGVL